MQFTFWHLVFNNGSFNARESYSAPAGSLCFDDFEKRGEYGGDLRGFTAEGMRIAAAFNRLRKPGDFTTTAKTKEGSVTVSRKGGTVTITIKKSALLGLVGGSLVIRGTFIDVPGKREILLTNLSASSPDVTISGRPSQIRLYNNSRGEILFEFNGTVSASHWSGSQLYKANVSYVLPQ